MQPVDIKTSAAGQPGRPPLPQVENRHWAWFLDVDGTLFEIERYPALVIADSRLLRLLNRLKNACDGAVALTSGRSLDQLEDVFGPLTLAAAASHGLELRAPDGTVQHLGRSIPYRFTDKITVFVEQHRGLLLEQKPFSMSVHYRSVPALEDKVLQTMREVQAELGDDFRLLRGKMVAEILPVIANKGSAIETFMRTPPFAGRRPVFVGDDVTDEDGFAVVNKMAGMSVRVGDAANSAARWQLANVSELRAWLKSALRLL